MCLLFAITEKTVESHMSPICEYSQEGSEVKREKNGHLLLNLRCCCKYNFMLVLQKFITRSLCTSLPATYENYFQRAIHMFSYKRTKLSYT